MPPSLSPALQRFRDLLHTSWTSFVTASKDAAISEQAFQDPLPSRSREPYRRNGLGKAWLDAGSDPTQLAHLVLEIYTTMFMEDRLSVAHLRHVQQEICGLAVEKEEASGYCVFLLTLFRLISVRIDEDGDVGDGAEVWEMVEEMLLGVARMESVDIALLHRHVAVFVRRVKLKGSGRTMVGLGLAEINGDHEYRAAGLLNAVCEGCEEIDAVVAAKLLAFSERVLTSAEGERPRTKAVVLQSILPCIASRGTEDVAECLAAFARKMWKWLSRRMQHEEDLTVLVGLVHGLREHRGILKVVFEDPLLWETLLVSMNGRQNATEQKRAAFLARAGVDIMQPSDKRWSQLLSVCDSMSEFEIHLVESAWEGVYGLLRRPAPATTAPRSFPVDFSSSWASLAISKGLHNSNPSVRKLTIISVLRLGASIDYATHDALPIEFIADEVLPTLNASELYRVSTAADSVTMDELAIVDNLADFCEAWYSSLPVQGNSRANAIQRLLATAPKLDAKIHQMLALFNAVERLEASPPENAAMGLEELDLVRTMVVRLHSQLTSHMLRKRSNKLLRCMAECIRKHLRVDPGTVEQVLNRICMVLGEVPQSVLTVDIIRPLGRLLKEREVFEEALSEMVQTCLESRVESRRTALALVVAATSQEPASSGQTPSYLCPLLTEMKTLYSRPYSPVQRKRCCVSLLGETLKLYRWMHVLPRLPIADWAGTNELFSFCEQKALAVMDGNESTALLEEALVEGGFRRVAVEESQVSLASKCVQVLSELQLAEHPAVDTCATKLRRAAVDVLRSTNDLVLSTQALTLLAATTERYSGSESELEELLTCVLKDEGLKWEGRDGERGSSTRLTKSSVISRRETVRWDVIVHLCKDASAMHLVKPELVRSLSEQCSAGILACSDRQTSQKIFTVSSSIGIQACFHPNTFAVAQAAFSSGEMADLDGPSSEEEFDRDELCARLASYLEGIKEQLKSPESRAVDAVSAYIEVAFHPAVMIISGMDNVALRPAWNAFERAFVNGQPAAFCALIRHCISNVWTRHAACTLRWTEEICRALTIRQDRSGFCTQDLLLDADAAAAAAYPRVAITTFLCSTPIRAVVELLIAQTANPKLESRKCMPQSDAYYEQLHIWQTLTCLANPGMSNFNDVDDSLFHCALDALDKGFLPEIRQLIDLTVVNCVLCRPKKLLPHILARAEEPSLSNATASSIMIDIMLVLKLVPKAVVPLMDVLRAVAPSATSPNGLVRIAAQHTLRTVLDHLGPKVSMEDAVWSKMQRHLKENKELVKMFARQEAWVETYDPREQATIHKLMVEGQNIFGEVHPRAVVYEMKKAMKQVFDEFRDQHEQWVPRDQPARSKDKRSERRTLAKAIAEEEDVDSLQYKIKPWEDCFDLMLPLSQPQAQESGSNRNGAKSKRSVNGVQEDARKKVAGKRVKQPLVVVGSLLDKIPNLGGLCRTCEIFSVEEYVVPNLSLAKNGTFKSVSIQAAEWMKLSEVVPNDLHAYLVQMKSKGYQVVALEQTSTSIPLQEYTVPSNEKVVLLLGIESEGIPASLLQVVDVCVEIPQYGVLRSLNVHVSGSMFIWEYTKQRLLQDAVTTAA